MRRVALVAALLIAALLTVAVPVAAAERRAPTPAQQAQQERMRGCNADARGKAGEERKAFMRECLRRR